jgi:hypothetical protein
MKNISLLIRGLSVDSPKAGVRDSVMLSAVIHPGTYHELQGEPPMCIAVGQVSNVLLLKSFIHEAEPSEERRQHRR